MNRHMETIKINGVNGRDFDRIIKNKDLEQVLGLQQHIEEIKEQSTQMLEDAKNRVAELKEQVYAEVTSKLRAENARQLKKLEENLEQLLTRLNTKLFDILYHVLDKLGYSENNSQHIKNLIAEEMGEILSQQVIKISANHNLTEKLKGEFPDHSSIIWICNNQLSDEECWCETKLWSLRIDVDTLKQQVNKLLTLGGTNNG